MERGLGPFKELIVGEKVFQIPIYQRNYSWEQPQLEDLWDDLIYLDKGKKHYFGTILLKKSGTKQSGLKVFDNYEIIDGQQRITTILILLKEMIIQFKDICTDDESKAELEDLEKNYLKYKDIYKLELLGDDSEFFRRQIIDDQDYPDETLTPSQRRLKFAKAFYRLKFRQVKSESKDYKKFLTEFKKKIDNLDIIRYPVENASDAVLIFETVNDRGKILSDLEKTKSFMMHMVYLSSESENPDLLLRRINERFANIYRYMEKIRSANRGDFLKEDSIQRYHFIIHEPGAKGDKDQSSKYLDNLKLASRELYRRKKEDCLLYVKKYTEDLEKAFFATSEIVNYNKGDEIGLWLSKLFALERVANFFPVLIAALIRFKNERERMAEILRLIEAFTFRVYVIGRRRADTGEVLADKLAYNIHNNLIKYEDIIDALKSMISSYEDTADFRTDMKIQDLYDKLSRRDLKYFFYEYEKYRREQTKEPIDFDLQSLLTDKFDIEHIWASNDEIIPEGLEEEHEENKNKLGNLTLASASWNRSWKDKPFKIKRKHYDKSVFRIQRELSQFYKWQRKQIIERERKLIKFAIDHWKID